ncbi:hypothetical protein HOLleu_26917 [Holothuria leucospilota]|uniref:Uncharacterized protein n=1 Tax=Holothuria leucospilota TaxID=206669 RepID=A0A9Q1H2U8_HOLLE|nr:hypothetical protein HOLleu_26917 [Holothuria leucospilota]
MIAYVNHSKEAIIIQHQDTSQDLWVLERQNVYDFTRLCTSDVYSYPLNADPTFNFANFHLTPFIYCHILLENKRSGVDLILLGPTAIHHSRLQPLYRKTVSAVTGNCEKLKERCKGFMTDAEQAIEDALEVMMPLRDFNHLGQNCKSKLISTPLQQKLFLDAVCGVQEERNGITDAKDGKDLKK